MKGNDKPTKQKRAPKYSRTGCFECKKSHSKCDEKRPRCGKCVKRGLACEYGPQFVYHTIEGGDRPTTSFDERHDFVTELTKSYKAVKLTDPIVNDRNSIDPSSATFDIKNFVYISPADLGLLDLLNSEDFDFSLYNQAQELPKTSLFPICWNNTSSIKRFHLLERHDPIRYLPENTDPNSNANYSFHNPKLADFVWSLMTSTRCGSNFILFPDEKFHFLMNLLRELNKSYSVIGNVLNYESALLMQYIYDFYERDVYFKNWDRCIRIPNLRSCLNTLEARINNSATYAECVALTFAVILLFCANSANRSRNWRTHLKGSSLLLWKLEELLPKGELTEMDSYAVQLHELLKDVFCHAELLAHITSDNGGSIYNPEKLKELLTQAPYSSINVLQSEYDLVRGYVKRYGSIFCLISLKILEMRQRGINLSGTNLVKFKLVQKDVKISYELHCFGKELLEKLESSPLKNDELKVILSEIHDLRLQLTMKCCNTLYYLALRLYLSVFFVNITIESEEALEILEEMLETAYSMPYYDSAGIACHWTIYLGALVSTLLNQSNLFDHFIDILEKQAENGLTVAENSTVRLRYIAKVLAEQKYDLLVNKDHDFIVF